MVINIRGFIKITEASFPGREKWVPQEIGYFDPFYDQKTTVTGGPIEHAGKNIHFRNVHVLINRMKNMVIIKGDKLVRNSFHICFKGKSFY